MNQNRLRELRFEKRITQWKLAILSGVQQSRISLFENGFVILREDEAKKIAKALSVKPSEFGGEREKSQESAR